VLAVAVTSHARPRAPRAKSRRAFRYAAALPTQPLGVEVLAAVRTARQQQGRTLPWDARLETSAIAVLAYLWRRGRGEKWAGCHGSARYGCAIAQLVIGLAAIMGWRGIPDRKDEEAVRRFVKRHRKSMQRWLDWLELAGLVSHTPQQDEEGFWWRTIIELHSCPHLPPELLHEAVKRRAGWSERERRRQARGRSRNLTAILRRARLSRAERRSRGIERRRELARCAERDRVRALVAESLARAVAKAHLTQPFGASTTSRTSLEKLSQDEASHRGLTRAPARFSEPASAHETSTPITQGTQPHSEEELRWAVYNEVKAVRFSRTDKEWESFIDSLSTRLTVLLKWPQERLCPRQRLIEAWAAAAHGPMMATAGAWRLALWRDQAEHHGPRLDRALGRYGRYATARPPNWPPGPAAAFAHFLAMHTPRQDGPQHGMAYDVARFNELTKQMSAYAHYIRAGHLKLAAKRAARRQQAQHLAEWLNQRLQFRLGNHSPAAKLRIASQLLNSDYPPHQAAGRAMCAQAMRDRQLAERDRRLLADGHPGHSDGRYRAACAYAERWGLKPPPVRWTA
jgi:hypothetical protein